MINLPVWLLLYATSANALIQECVTSMNGENYFKYTGSSYKSINSPEDPNCKEIANSKQFYFITNDLNCNETCKIECADESIEKEVYFPKCCPPKYFYQPEEHKCVNYSTKREETVDSVFLVKSGLENCKVIADYIFFNFDELVIRQDRSVEFQDEVYSQGNYCFDEVFDDESYVLRACHSMEFCRNSEITGVRCIKKCCPDGYFYKGLECAPEFGHGIELRKFNDSIRDINDNFALVTNETCKKYLADRETYQFYVEKNGSILITELDIFREYTVDQSYYCIEHIEFENLKMDSFLLCTIKNDQPDVRYNFTRVVLLMSSICLALTIMGYLLLPELRNLIGKLVICYCSSLFVAFVFLSWIQFVPYGYNYCIAAGYIITFSVLAAFTWMNIISYDIWCAIGSMKIQHGNQKQKEIKKFILYNIYGWTVPTVITSFAALDNTFSVLPQSLHAHIGQLQCMIDKYLIGNYGYHFFVATPCGLLIVSNLVIFIKTVRYVLKVKNEINKMKDLDESQTQRKIIKRDMERIFMVLKIFIITGVSWLFEIISLIIDFKQNQTLSVIETILDVFNCLQGVFIFCIFMLKEKVIYAVAKKLGIGWHRRDQSPRNTSTTEIMLKSASSPDMMLRKGH